MKILYKLILALIFALIVTGCSKTPSPSSDFLRAELHGYMDKVGYKDLHLTVQQLVDYSSDEEARHWSKVSDIDWSLTLDVPNGNKIVMLLRAVPELKGGVLLKSVKGKDINLEGFGVMTFTSMLQADQKTKLP